jgi:hypothetical protein
MQNLKKKLYFGLIGLFFTIQILSFILSHYIIFQVYLYDKYFHPYWEYALFSIFGLAFLNCFFIFVIEMTLGLYEMKTKFIFVGSVIPFLILFNYESAFWALTCGTISLLITLFWYYLLYVNRKK